MHTLQIQNLSKTYPNGVTAIQNVNLEIRNGMFGLLGPNGSGKSTFMRTIAGLQSPDSGTIALDGVDVVADPMHMRQRLGYLPQEFGVYPRVSAWDLLDHLAILKGLLDKPKRKAQVSALLEQTNLFAHRHQAVRTFSGGMRQRFGIAQALLGSPQVIMVDEPTAGLDPEERQRFNNMLSEIGEQVIVILSTHLVEDVRALCTQMAIIAGGKLLATGSPIQFVAELDGQIWRKTIPKSELQHYQQSQRVLYTQHFAGELEVVIHSQSQPTEGFKPKAADLIDAYFFHLQKHDTYAGALLTV